MGMQSPIVPVTIKLKSTIQHPGQDPEHMELVVDGTLVEKAGSRYLRYEEQQERNTVKTMIKLDPEDAVIMRTGAIQMRLPLAPNGTRFGTYSNGPLAIDLQVITKTLNVTVERDSGNFHVCYEMHANEKLLGNYQLTITYVEGTK